MFTDLKLCPDNVCIDKIQLKSFINLATTILSQSKIMRKNVINYTMYMLVHITLFLVSAHFPWRCAHSFRKLCGMLKSCTLLQQLLAVAGGPFLLCIRVCFCFYLHIFLALSSSLVASLQFESRTLTFPVLNKRIVLALH